MNKNADITVRNTKREDFAAIQELFRRVYPHDRPWEDRHLESHLRVFPEGQMVAVDESGRVVGMSASLIVDWDDYSFKDSYRDFTDEFMFSNHDPAGRTLYAAEVMVDPDFRGRGIGGLLYEARRKLVRRLGLVRIRAGARLRGYHRFADRITPKEYTRAVVAGSLRDPTLTFQLHQGFSVIGIVFDYWRNDPESLGHAALIEWINEEAIEEPPPPAEPAPVPVEIDRSAETEVRITWQDGHETVYPARSLRLLCPCAGCVDEATGERILDPTSVPEDVRALSASLVGRYAISIRWSDGHSTGIYPFTLLREACPCPRCSGGSRA